MWQLVVEGKLFILETVFWLGSLWLYLSTGSQSFRKVHEACFTNFKTFLGFTHFFPLFIQNKDLSFYRSPCCKFLSRNVVRCVWLHSFHSFQPIRFVTTDVDNLYVRVAINHLLSYHTCITYVVAALETNPCFRLSD